MKPPAMRGHSWAAVALLALALASSAGPSAATSRSMLQVATNSTTAAALDGVEEDYDRMGKGDWRVGFFGVMLVISAFVTLYWCAMDSRRIVPVYVISGVVLNALTGEPQVGVVVVCTKKEEEEEEEEKLLDGGDDGGGEEKRIAAAAAPAAANGGVFRATTDAKGEYTLEVGEGSYDVTVPESADFAAASNGVQSVTFRPAAQDDAAAAAADGDDKTKLDGVSPAPAPDDDAAADGSTDAPAVFDFEVMPAPRAVSGCVTDEETKKPVPGMSVTLKPCAAPKNVNRNNAMQTHVCTTDDTGVYSAAGVLPGEYEVEMTSDTGAYKTKKMDLSVADADVVPGGAADACVVMKARGAEPSTIYLLFISFISFFSTHTHPLRIRSTQ